MVYQNNNELRAMLNDGESAMMVLSNILHQMDGFVFGKRKTEVIVGGPGKLRELIEHGAIRVSYENGREYYNASDVLLRCRPNGNVSRRSNKKDLQ